MTLLFKALIKSQERLFVRLSINRFRIGFPMKGKENYSKNTFLFTSFALPGTILDDLGARNR